MPCDNGDHAGERARRSDIHPCDPRVGQMASKELAVEHPWQKQIVREPRLTGRLGRAVDLSPGPADDPEVAGSTHRRVSLRAPPGASGTPSRIRAAARSTA